MGFPKEVVRKPLTGIDELRRKKKEKSLMEAFGLNPSKAYLWGTLANLLRVCKIERQSSKKNEEKTEEESYFLTIEE